MTNNTSQPLPYLKELVAFYNCLEQHELSQIEDECWFLDRRLDKRLNDYFLLLKADIY